MTKCSKCHRDRCSLDDHKVCLACIGCTSVAPCRRCAPWAEDKWEACLSFYTERDAPKEDGDESEHSDTKSDRESEDSEPPTLEDQRRPPEEEKKEDDVVGPAVSSGATANGKAEQSDDSRESRSRSRSRERYLRTEDRERTHSSARDKREKRRRRSPSREASPPRRRRRDRSPSPEGRESSRRRGRSPPRRVRERRERTPERRAPRSEVRPVPLANDGYCDWFSEPRVVFQDDFAGGQHAYEEMYGPQEDPLRQWGMYEDYYITEPPPPPMYYNPRYAPYPDPRLVYQAGFDAPPPRKVIRKRPPKHVRQAQQARQAQQVQHEHREQEDDVDDDDDDPDEDEQDLSEEDEQHESSGSSTSDVESDDETGGKAKIIKGKEFKMAVKRIQKLLPFTRSKSSSSDKRTGYSAGSLADQEALRKKARSRSLPQPPNLKKAVIAMNKFVHSSNIKGSKKSFLSAAAFPKGMEMSFKLDWYAKEGATSYFDCNQPTMCEDASLFAGSVEKGMQNIPEMVEKTATLARNALAVGGFLELASNAIETSVDSNRSAKKIKKDVKIIAKVATRAAYHVQGNAMLAAANMDLARKDVMISNFPNVSKLNKSMLRAAPLGGTTFFDKETCANIRRKFPESIHLDGNNNRGRGGKSRPFQPGRGGRGQSTRQNSQANNNNNNYNKYNANAGSYNNRGNKAFNNSDRGARGRGRGRGDGKQKGQ